MYNVAFRYTKKAGGYEGVVTWSSYQSKADFDKNHRPHLLAAGKHEVIAEGITDDECIDLVRETPTSAYYAAAMQETGISRTTALMNLIYVMGERGE